MSQKETKSYKRKTGNETVSYRGREKFPDENLTSYKIFAIV